MMMPALLPEDLMGYAQAESEEALFSALIRQPSDLIRFFDYAADDETWSEKNADFMRRTLVWLTAQSFQDKLSAEFVQMAAKTIRGHFDLLRTRLPYNLIFKLSDTSIQANSAMYSAASPFFHDLIRRECFDKKNFKLEFLSVSYASLFRYVEEFVNTSEVSTLWRMELAEVMDILRYSASLQMPGLSELCEGVLAKYLDPHNVCTMLLMAQKESLHKLKLACFEFINNQSAGILLESRGMNTIACKFLNFSEKGIDLFDKISAGITHLIFSDEIPSDANFAKVIKQCPYLIALDLSHTTYYTEYFSAVPSTLQDLNLSACEWLSTHYLKKIAEICPNLQKLSLASNVQLSARSWGELLNLNCLSGLDLSRCQQMRDDDFKIILHASAGVTELSIEDCKLLSDRAFFDLSRSCTRLQKLNLSRTRVNDASLVEIAARCRSLTHLNLTRSENITDRGVLEAAKHAFNLQEIDITACHVSKSTIEEVHKLRPMLHVITAA